jgi:hypothetical protein
MRMYRLALAGLAGLAGIGLALAFAGPASAATAGPSGADLVPAGTATTQVLTAGSAAGGAEPEAQASRRKNKEWSGGAAYDLDSGKWRAFVTDGDQTAVFGEYDSRQEAEDNGKAQADAMNGKVVDAPECIPPILC